MSKQQPVPSTSKLADKSKATCLEPDGDREQEVLDKLETLEGTDLPTRKLAANGMPKGAHEGIPGAPKEIE